MSIYLYSTVAQKIVSATGNDLHLNIANDPFDDELAQFSIEKNNDGTISFYSAAKKKFVSAIDGGWALKIAKDNVDEWCKFEVKKQDTDTIALWSPVAKKFVSPVGGGPIPLKIAKDNVDEWCKFKVLRILPATEIDFSDLTVNGGEVINDKEFEEFLQGHLKSSSQGKKIQVISISNAIQLPLIFAYIDSSGRLGFRGKNGRGLSLPSMKLEGKPPVVATDGESVAIDTYLAVFTQLTGSLVTILKVKEANIQVTDDMIRKPNQIGSFLTPTKIAPIPPDSPRVLVGYGKNGKGLILREQFWHREVDSYVLAPGETRTVSYTITSGMQKTTSEQQDIATSLNVNSSAGWGTISASISASLNQQSSSFQQFTIQTESTRFESVELKNESDKARMFLKWTLHDIVTIFDEKNLPVTSIVHVESPVLVGGPYDPSQLPT